MELMRKIKGGEPLQQQLLTLNASCPVAIFRENAEKRLTLYFHQSAWDFVNVVQKALLLGATIRVQDVWLSMLSGRYELPAGKEDEQLKCVTCTWHQLNDKIPVAPIRELYGCLRTCVQQSEQSLQG